MPGKGTGTLELGGSPGGTGGQSGTARQDGIYTQGVEHISRILTTASGNVDATAGGTELFATAHPDRRAVTITNTHATATNYLYILVTGSAGTPTITAAVYRERLSGSDPSITIPCGPDSRIFIFGVAGNTSYMATEEAWANA